MRKNTSKPSGFKITIKLIAAFLLAYLWLYIAFAMIGEIWEESKDKAEQDYMLINWCDEYYYEKDYGRLLDYLKLYDAYDEKYDVYWEVVDAYTNYLEWEKWSKISEETFNDARAMEEMYYDKVMNASKNCRFSQNQKYIDDFAKSMQ